MAPRYSRTAGWGLLTVTFFLVALGFYLFISSMVGWAQLFWVIASGTSGAGIVMVLEKKE